MTKKIENYNAINRVNVSSMPYMLEAPYYYQQEINRRKQKTGKHFGFGSLVHDILDGEDAFQNRVIQPAEVPPKMVGVTLANLGKTLKEHALKNDLQYLTAVEYETALAMVEELKRDEDALAILRTPAETEVIVEWEYQTFDGRILEMKSRLDRVMNEARKFSDYKTTRAKTHSEFERFSFYKYNTHLQLFGYKCASGFDEVILMVQSKTAPFHVFMFDDFSECWDNWHAEFDRIATHILNARERYGSEFETSNIWGGSKFFHVTGAAKMSLPYYRKDNSNKSQ